jgi:uncharacterized protein (DUF427 family)
LAISGILVGLRVAADAAEPNQPGGDQRPNGMARFDTSSFGWSHVGRQRPPFAETPGPGQESVWDYPRPPRLAADPREVVVKLDDVVVATTRRAIRVLETASPPTFYLPWADVTPGMLASAPGTSWCEWKGEARYWSLVTAPGRVERVGWSYPAPSPGFAAIREHVAFYASRLECFVAGERVRPQPGGFYGGWITGEIVGPFKGELGTSGW